MALFCKQRCMLSCFSHIQLCANLWNAACQAPLSMGFFRREYWSGLPCPPPGDLSDPGIEPVSVMSNLHWQVVYLPLVPPGKPCKQRNASYFIKVPLTTIWCEPNLETEGSIWRRYNVAKGRVRRCEVHFRDKIDRTLSSWICLKGKKIKELSVHFNQGRQWCC